MNKKLLLVIAAISIPIVQSIILFEQSAKILIIFMQPFQVTPPFDPQHSRVLPNPAPAGVCEDDLAELGRLPGIKRDPNVAFVILKIENDTE